MTEHALQVRIVEAAAAAAADQPAALEDAFSRIGQLFAQSAIPDEIAEEIRRAYAQLGEGDEAVAVHSSATAEDLPDLSFAGQQETYLNIRGEARVFEAVKCCWTSLWTERTIGYRARHHIPPQAVSLAVVVQVLVPAAAAGCGIGRGRLELSPRLRRLLGLQRGHAYRPGHVFGTTNGGLTWMDISGNLPDAPVNTILLDPSDLNTLYAGTDVGALVTHNPSGSWTPLGSGLPIVMVAQLSLNLYTRQLRVATYGRAMLKESNGSQLVSKYAPRALSAVANASHGRAAWPPERRAVVGTAAPRIARALPLAP